MDLSYYHLNILANLIITRYYNNTRCVLVFSEQNEQIFSYQGPLPTVQIEIFNDTFDPDVIFEYHGCQGVIIQSENPSLIFGQFEKLIRFNRERFNQRRYMLLLSSGKNLDDVFTMAELIYVADFLVVVPDGDNFELLTHKYVGTSAGNKPVVLDKWMGANRSFVHGSDLYPDKISNQQGRELRMATLEYEPYSVIGDSVSNYLGSELSTATHFGLKHNMTPVPVINALEYWGEIFTNWTGNGILGNLVMDKADVGFGSMDTWETSYRYLDLSKPVVRTGVTCLVPAAQLAAGWFTPLLSFTPQLWICVGFVYGSGTLVFSLIQYYNKRIKFSIRNKIHHQNSSSFVQMLGASAIKIGRHFLLQAVGDYEIPSELNGRFMMLLMITSSLILAITYSSGLASIMAIPRYDHSIQTIDDLVSSGLSWGAPHEAWITSIEEAEEAKYKMLVARFVVASEKDLRAYALDGRFGFAVERLPFKRCSICIMDLLYHHLNILANLIITGYYNNTRCLLIFSENAHIFDYKGPLPSVQISIFENGTFDADMVFNSYGCQGVIIQSENPSPVFGEFERQIRLGMERFNRRRFLLLSSGKNLDVFTMAELNYVADFLLAVPDGGENFDLLTHKYAGPGDGNNAVVLDKWMAANQSFVYGADLYPDKILNQQGRELRMATLQYEPYSVIGDSVSNYLGSELSTATHFGLKHNMTPVPVINALEYWGEIFTNWTGNGILGNLVMDKADVGFGSMDTWETSYRYLDLSKPVVRTGVTCLVPAPKLAAGWFTPLLSFTPQLWICVGFVYGSGTLVFSLIQYYNKRIKFSIRNKNHQNSSSFVQILGASAIKIGRHFLLQAVGDYDIPSELNGRFMMLLMIISSLILATTYNSGLASIMAIPRYDHAIQTIDDLVSSGLSWGAPHEAWITSIEEAEEAKYKMLVARFVVASEEDLRAYALDGRFGFAVERLPFNNFAIGTYIQRDVIANFRLMQEDIYWEHTVIMLRRNSVLLPYLDAFILRAFETGLISKWQSTAVQLSMDSVVQKAVNIYNKHLREHQVVKLELTDVAGTFVFLVVGLFISFLVFLYELMVNKSQL